MLRIEVSETSIIYELYNSARRAGQVARPRVYANTPENLAIFNAQIAETRLPGKDGSQRRIDYYYSPDEPTNSEVFIVYHRPHYRVVGGTHYDERTPAALCDRLENWRKFEMRLRFTFGSPFTGEVWGQDNQHPAGYQETGLIGRSLGSPIKSPILLPTARSTGGGILDTAHILMVEASNKRDGGVLWIAPAYQARIDETAAAAALE